MTAPSSTRAPAPGGTGALPAAVLFDMDGTLVDTEPAWIEAEYAMVAAHGGAWDDDKAHSLVGLDLRDSARVIQTAGGVDLEVDEIVERLLDSVILSVRRKIPWRPGARELLAGLSAAGVPCALVTMSWRRFADAIVDALPPGSFAAVVPGDEVAHGKPHPEPFRRAAELLGVDPSACVAIEDSPNGLSSAVAAGCHVIAVPNVVPLPQSNQYRRVSSLTKLTPQTLLPAAGPSVPPADVTRRRRLTALAAIAALIAVVVGLVVIVGGDERAAPPPPPDIPIDAWAPYWQLDAAMTAVSNYGSWFREISPLWYDALGATTVLVDEHADVQQNTAFLAAARATGARIVPSVQDHMAAGGMAAVLADSATRTAHVDTLAALARDQGFDGIDLDYEVFAFGDAHSTWTATRAAFTAFVAELADRLHAEGRVLTVSVPPIYDNGTNGDSGYWVYDYRALAEHVDHVRVMAYDWSTSEPGPIAPIDFVKRAIDGAKGAIEDHSKIVLGVPIYGRNWVVATTGECPANTPDDRTAVDQRTIAELVDKRNATVVHDAVTGESSFTYDLASTDGTKTCTQTREVHFVDAQGSRLRVDMARTAGLGGAAIFALGDDSDATWTAIGTLARRDAAPLR